MNRLKSIKKLYKDIGGVHAPIIGELQKLFDFPVGKSFSQKTNVEIVDELADKKLKFEKVRELIAFESKVQGEFESTSAKIEQNIRENGNISSLNKLGKELNDIFEAIKHCYITINSDYQKFELRREELSQKIDDQKIIKGAFKNLGP